MSEIIKNFEGTEMAIASDGMWNATVEIEGGLSNLSGNNEFVISANFHGTGFYATLCRHNLYPPHTHNQNLYDRDGVAVEKIEITEDQLKDLMELFVEELLELIDSQASQGFWQKSDLETEAESEVVVASS